MLKKLVDTNILIDRFLEPELHKDIFLSEGLVYLSAVVYMELRAGAHTKEGVRAVTELLNHFTLWVDSLLRQPETMRGPVRSSRGSRAKRAIRSRNLLP